MEILSTSCFPDENDLVQGEISNSKEKWKITATLLLSRVEGMGFSTHVAGSALSRAREGIPQ